jgi:predicted metal-dependent phosphoesterase TrpH
MKDEKSLEVKVDLHLHSNYSDGSDTPTEIVQKAKTLGLEVIALTDHDTTNGWEEWRDAGSKNGIKLIPGIEFSIEGLEGVDEVHLLGYFPDASRLTVSELEKYALSSVQARERRLSQMVALLRDCGLQINEEEVRKEVKGKIINRHPHITTAVYRLNSGRFKEPREVLEMYLLPGREAYVQVNDRPSLKQAIGWVKELGGIAILAHPGGYNNLQSDPIRGERILLKALEYGADGGEGHYVYHKNDPYRRANCDSSITPLLCQQYIDLLVSRGKIATSGSDYHGKNKKIEMGEQGGRMHKMDRFYNHNF